jgi:arginine exporter protein ArgO
VTGALVAGLVAGYGIALPVGAVAAYLVALTARTSLRVGAAAAMGVATVDGLYALVAILAGAAIGDLLRPIAGSLRWLSAIVLIALAVRVTATAVRQFRVGSELGQSVTTPSAVRAFAILVGITIVNPLTVVYFAALVLGSQADAGMSVAERVVFVAAAFLASASWQLTLACGGALLGRSVTGQRGRLVTALASALLITTLAVLPLL